MKRNFLIVTLLFAFGCLADSTDSSTWKSGQVLSESTQNLDGGFLLVRREVVNPPKHWERVGHFSFLYFRQRQLCQCSHGDFSIAPSNRYALVQDGPTGKLLLFNAQTERMTEATTKYVGSPQSFRWDEAKRSVTVMFYQRLNNGYKDAAPLSIPLQ